jgi:hypothetical protein
MIAFAGSASADRAVARGAGDYSEPSAGPPIASVQEKKAPSGEGAKGGDLPAEAGGTVWAQAAVLRARVLPLPAAFFAFRRTVRAGACFAAPSFTRP